MNSNFNSPYFYIHFWKVSPFWSIKCPEADGWPDIVGQHSPYSPDYVISDYIVDQIVGAFSIPVKVLAEVVDYQEQRWDWVNNNEDPDSSELFPKSSFNYRVVAISLGSLESQQTLNVFKAKPIRDALVKSGIGFDAIYTKLPKYYEDMQKSFLKK